MRLASTCLDTALPPLEFRLLIIGSLELRHLLIVVMIYQMRELGYGAHYCLRVSALNTACCLAISDCTPRRAKDSIFASCCSSNTWGSAVARTSTILWPAVMAKFIMTSRPESSS